MPRESVTSSLLVPKTKKPLLSEKDVERLGDDLMQQLGFAVIRFSQARATMQTEGIPDRRYYHPGWRVALWWEAKRPGGKQRPAQKRFQALCDAVGDLYVLGTHEALAAQVHRLRAMGVLRGQTIRL